MYMYKYIHTDIYIYINVCVHRYICIKAQCVYMYIVISIYTHLNMCIYMQLCVLISTRVNINCSCVCFLLSLSHDSSSLYFVFILCSVSLRCLAICLAACRACLITSPPSITLLLILAITRRRDVATTAQCTPSTCRATACVCSAPTARTRTVLVPSIALFSRPLGCSCATYLLQCVSVLCHMLQRDAHEVMSCATHLSQRVAVCCSVLLCCNVVLKRWSLV